MKRHWSREDTQFWITQLEHRIKDIDYHLKLTIDWCEENDVYSDQQVFACAMMTVIWVSYMRGEPVSKREAYELLGIEDWDQAPDEKFELNQKYKDWDLEELLWEVVGKF